MRKEPNIFELIHQYITNRRYQTEADYMYGTDYFISATREEIEKIIRTESFDPNQKNENGSPILNEVAKDIRLLWLVRPILGNPNLHLPCIDENGNNPYQIAIKFGNPIAADLLFHKFGVGSGSLSPDHATRFQCKNFDGKEFFYAYDLDNTWHGEKIKAIKAKLVHEGDPVYDKNYDGWIRNGYIPKHKPYAAVVDAEKNEWMGWFMEPTDQIDTEGAGVTTNPYIWCYDGYCKIRYHEINLCAELEETTNDREKVSATLFGTDEDLESKVLDIE